MSATLSTVPTDEDVRFFNENGYWIAPKLISDRRLAELRDHMERVYQGEHETGRAPWSASWLPGDSPFGLRKTDNSHWADRTLRALAVDQEIGRIAAALMRTQPVRLWHDQLLHKPGGGKTTGNVGWHQDYGYWQCAEPPTLVTAWVAFDDVTPANGCMQVIPRSHRWGLLDETDFFNTDLAGQESRMKIPPGEKLEKVPCAMKAGQVSFHHSLTLHGSGPNTTDAPRRSMAIHLIAGDVRYKAGSPADAHMNVKLLQPVHGQAFAGEQFPVLYPPGQRDAD
jgi:ectoine hydroxylase-related dioxygenase (phytanoyl-CoA dioxygenase family)